MDSWSPTSWQNYSYEQAAAYPNEQRLFEVTQELSKKDPIVFYDEIQNLKQLVAAAGRNEAFLLQGGDCAESFIDCRPDKIVNKLKILMQMTKILNKDLQKPIIPIGRIAGQYSKPRSSNFETIDNITLPSYRGDLINQPSFDATSRQPDPELLLKGYECSLITIKFINHLLKGNFNQFDLSKFSPCHYDSTFLKLELEHLEKTLTDLKKPHFFSSHEALHLYYEQALTRQHTDSKWYNLSTHLPWVGLRTAKLNSAHIEYIRGIHNPVGIKVSQATSPELLVKLIKLINPTDEEGKVLVITRFGSEHISNYLPDLIHTIKKADLAVTWSCDPMHGNTEITKDGIKTRYFSKILNELKTAIAIHKKLGSYLGGIHLELTGEKVTECIGGAKGYEVAELNKAYFSLVDPRLNSEQSLELCVQLGLEYSKDRSANYDI